LASAEAERTRLMGEGEAKRIRALAESEAMRAANVGIAQALAIEEQVRAYGGPQFQLVQQVMNRFAEAVEKSQVDVVPKITMGGMDGKNGSGLIEGLLGTLLSEKLAHLAGITQSPPRDTQAQSIRDDILKGVSEKRKDGPKS
jgi:uncharacterized membrane protein YqiK